MSASAAKHCWVHSLSCWSVKTPEANKSDTRLLMDAISEFSKSLSEHLQHTTHRVSEAGGAFRLVFLATPCYGCASATRHHDGGIVQREHTMAGPDRMKF